MNNPFVSVIIPNYCHSKFLDERIMSVLNQTYQNFELIILDDCSPDNGASKAVIEKYRNNPKVSHIVYNEVNSGSTFKQWNKGFDLAKGELIWIAESDDSCENTLIEKLVVYFENDMKCVLSFCGSNKVDYNGNVIEKQRRELKSAKWEGLDFIRERLYYSNAIGNASAAIFKKNIAVQIDNTYMSYKGSGDLLFWIELSQKGNVYFVGERLNKFRQHTNNTTNKCYSSGLNFIELKKIHQYLMEKSLINNYQSKLLTQRMTNEIVMTNFYDKSTKIEMLHLWHSTMIMKLKAYINKCIIFGKNIIRDILRK